MGQRKHGTEEQETWDRGTRRHRRFDVDTIGANFKTELGRLIRQIIEICPSDEHKEAVQYVNGKMETIDIPASNVQLVSIGLHACVKIGNLSKNFRGDSQMALRCTRIAEIHVLAYKGIAGLPAGVAIGQADCAPLPISANPIPNQMAVLEPISVRKTSAN